MMFVSPRASAAFALVAGLMGLTTPPLAGQVATVRVEENLRVAPNEAIVGVLSPGTELTVVDQRPGWLQVELGGWVWTRSLQLTDRDGFDLVVVPEDPGETGENLRSRPSGPVLARLVRGALLAEQERIPGWVRVTRRAWVWSASVEVDESAATAPPVGDDAPAAPVEFHRVGGRGAPLLRAPDGDTLAHTAPGADIAVLARQGSWARVRIEGWVWMPDTAVVPEPAGGDAGEATVVGVATDPVGWRGRMVTWDLQFISLERAESVRTDFYEGEPFLLTRAVDEAGSPFVYVALPPERVAEAERLRPLERVRIVGRVRVGASTLTGSPILDLVDLQRVR